MKNFGYVLLLGFVKGNLGDDLFFKIICERYPKQKFVIAGESKYVEFYRSIKNLRYVRSDGLVLKIVSKIVQLFIKYIAHINVNRSECVTIILKQLSSQLVMIGGSMFIEMDDWRSRLNGYRIIFDQNTHIVGCNFGPFTSNDFFNEYNQLFKRVNEISFRDNYSYLLFPELDNSRVCPDIVFGTKKNRAPVDSKVGVVISPILLEHRENLNMFSETYYEFIADLVENLLERNHKITFISFCDYQGDNLAIDKIVGIISKKNIYKEMNIQIHMYQNIDDTLDIISSAEAIICTRFHAMILGFAFNKSVLPIIYDEKMINIVNECNFNGRKIHISEIKWVQKSDMSELIDSLLEYQNIDVELLQASGHFQLLDRVLY